MATRIEEGIRWRLIHYSFVPFNIAMSKFSFYGRCLFFFLFSAALIAVFLTSIIQGVLIQIQGAFLIALGLYIVAWVCLGTSIILFNKAVRLLKIVNF